MCSTNGSIKSRGNPSRSSGHSKHSVVCRVETVAVRSRKSHSFPDVVVQNLTVAISCILVNAGYRSISQL